MSYQILKVLISFFKKLEKKMIYFCIQRILYLTIFMVTDSIYNTSRSTRNKIVIIILLLSFVTNDKYLFSLEKHIIKQSEKVLWIYDILCLFDCL